MNDIYYFSYTGWLILGITLGFGPCAAHQSIIVLSYIGLISAKMKTSLINYMIYSLARIITYSMLGLLSGIIGSVFYNLITDTFFIRIAGIGLGIILIALAIFVLYKEKNPFCRVGNEKFVQKKGKAMALLGVMTVMLPCPALLGLFAYAAASGRMFYGVLSGFLLAVGSTISPLVAAVPFFGLLKQKVTSKRFHSVIRYISAFLLFAYGLHVIINTVF